jgi:hypothetical protein
MRLAYLSGSGAISTVPDDARSRWEASRFHDENVRAQDVASARQSVLSPDRSRRTHLAKVVANKPEHLDHLLAIRPPSVQLARAT